MKAAVYKGNGVIAVEEVPTPVPGRGELLIRIRYCGICGTDLHNYSYNILSAGAILGHEWSGVVEGLGEGVTGFQPGDRVMCFLHGGARTSGARTGGAQAGGAAGVSQNLRIDPRAIYSAPTRRGAFAEYITASTSRVIRTPDSVSDEAAACLEPLVAAIHAVRLGNPKKADSVAFIGAGPIALFMIQRVKQLGVKAVYVSEISPTRAAKAAELGADSVFNPLKDDVVAAIVGLTGGKGPEVVFECAAAENTLNEACKLVALNGRITCLAVYQGAITLEPLDWYMMQPEIKFTTNRDSTPSDWEFCLKILQKRSIDVESIITDLVPLDEVGVAFHSLLTPTANRMLRVLVEP